MPPTSGSIFPAGSTVVGGQRARDHRPPMSLVRRSVRITVP